MVRKLLYLVRLLTLDSGLCFTEPMLRLLEILCAMLTLIMLLQCTLEMRRHFLRMGLLLRLLLCWRILRPHAAAPLPLALNWRKEVAVRLRTLAACLRTIKRARCGSAASKQTGAATASRAEPATTAAGGSGTHGRRRIQSWRPRALRRVCVLAFAANSLVPRRLLRPRLLRQNSLGTDGIQKFLKCAQATGSHCVGSREAHEFDARWCTDRTRLCTRLAIQRAGIGEQTRAARDEYSSLAPMAALTWLRSRLRELPEPVVAEKLSSLRRFKLRSALVGSEASIVGSAPPVLPPISPVSDFSDVD